MSFEREPEDMRKHGNTIKRCIPECHSAPFHYILLVSHPTGKSPRQKVLTFFTMLMCLFLRIQISTDLINGIMG